MLIPQWMWFAYLLWNAYPHHQSETSAVFGQEHPAILARFCDPSEGTWQRKMWWSSRVSVAKWAEIRLVSDIQWWHFRWQSTGVYPPHTPNNPWFLTVTKLFLPCLMNMCRNNCQLANDLDPALLLLFPCKKNNSGLPTVIWQSASDDLYHSYP